MSLPVLLFAAIATIIAAYYAQRLPPPWGLVAIAVIVVVWLAALLNLLGVGGMHLGRVG